MEAIKELEQSFAKPQLPQVQSGDTVRVHQVIREGNKKRVQIFEGVIIRTHRLGELTAVITVRRIASGVGVEKTFLLHSPNVTKVDVVRRSKVRRNFLSYLRARRGKSARLSEVSFDRAAANVAEAKTETGASIKEGEQVVALAAQQAADDSTDAGVIEVNQDESVVADESTEAEIKQENAAVAADDATAVGDNPDETAVEAEEAEAGEAKAENEDSRAQRPVE